MNNISATMMGYRPVRTGQCGPGGLGGVVLIPRKLAVVAGWAFFVAFERRECQSL